MKVKILVVSLVALLAFGGTALAGKNTKQVESKVTLEFDQGNSTDPYDPFAEATFSGKVKALDVGGKTEKKCENNRIVRIKRIQSGPDATFGTATTDENGNYSLPAADTYEEGGTFKAKVERRKRNDANINCLPDVSPEVTVP